MDFHQPFDIVEVWFGIAIFDRGQPAQNNEGVVLLFHVFILLFL